MLAFGYFLFFSHWESKFPWLFEYHSCGCLTVSRMQNKEAMNCSLLLMCGWEKQLKKKTKKYSTFKSECITLIWLEYSKAEQIKSARPELNFPAVYNSLTLLGRILNQGSRPHASYVRARTLTELDARTCNCRQRWQRLIALTLLVKKGVSEPWLVIACCMRSRPNISSFETPAIV